MRITIAVPLAVLLCILASTIAWSAPIMKESNLPGFKGSPIRPRISGDWVVWRQNEDDKACLSKGKGIICYNLVTKEAYTVYEGQSSLCNAGDGMATWTGIKGKLSDFCRGKTDYSDEPSNLIVLELGTWKYYNPPLEAGPAIGPAISGKYVAYLGQGGIYLLDLSTGQQKRISVGENKPSVPEMSGDIVVWDQCAGKREIHGYSISQEQEFPIASDPENDLISPDTDGITVVWYDKKHHIWAYDIGTAKKKRLADGFYSAVDDGIVAYMKNDLWVYGMDLRDGEEFRISSGPSDSGPEINAGRVIWFKGNKITVTELSSK